MKQLAKRVYQKLRHVCQRYRFFPRHLLPKHLYRRFKHQKVLPYSYIWGGDRGTEIARFHIDQFLKEHQHLIRGACLEFQDPVYLNRFSNEGIQSVDILHVDDSNPLATHVADLTQPNQVPSNSFDCIICTHVLHVVYDKRTFLSEIHRILKPTGNLLIAVPAVTMCDPAWKELWRFTEFGLDMLLKEAFSNDKVKVVPYGNSLTAGGQIRGLAAEDFSLSELNYTDTRFALEICAVAQK